MADEGAIGHAPRLIPGHDGTFQDSPPVFGLFAAVFARSVMS